MGKRSRRVRATGLTTASSRHGGTAAGAQFAYEKTKKRVKKQLDKENLEFFFPQTYEIAFEQEYRRAVARRAAAQEAGEAQGADAALREFSKCTLEEMEDAVCCRVVTRARELNAAVREPTIKTKKQAAVVFYGLLFFVICTSVLVFKAVFSS